MHNSQHDHHQALLHTITRYAATALIAVPAMITDLRDAATLSHTEPLVSVRRVLVGGGGPSPAQLAALQWLFPSACIVTAYGMSEASSSITFDRPSPNVAQHADTSCNPVLGRPPEGVRVRLADDGEIHTAGPHVMLRYWGDEESTARAIDRDGWLHTGRSCCFPVQQQPYVQVTSAAWTPVCCALPAAPRT